MEGFIDVLTNDAFPGLVKIGRTIHDPRRRAGELYTTGVPMPFNVAFCVSCCDPAIIEDAIHLHLEECRVNDSREFFRVSVRVAVSVVATFAMHKFKLKTVLHHQVIPHEVFEIESLGSVPLGCITEMLPYILKAAPQDVLELAKAQYIAENCVGSDIDEGNDDGR
jgi:hypothetical protein